MCVCVRERSHMGHIIIVNPLPFQSAHRLAVQIYEYFNIPILNNCEHKFISKLALYWTEWVCATACWYIYYLRCRRHFRRYHHQCHTKKNRTILD